MKKAIVYGAGLSGMGAKELLEKMSYEVCLVDDIKAIRSEEIIDKLNEYDIFIKSPGIANTNKLVQEAKKVGLECIDEVELASRHCKCKIIAVTGTNGKTTVTSKIADLLNFANYKVEVAGNIGVSFAKLVASEKELDFVVLELSSYQLENIVKLKPFVSMIINLTPDHLNRYECMDDYYKAKLNIFRNQDKSDYFIVNKDDKNLLRLLKDEKINSKILSISKKNTADFKVEKKDIYYNETKVCQVEKLSLKGIHNLENNLFIIATGKILGIENSIISEFLYNTKGLEHRTELFLKKGLVEFINDSKGTNLDSTLKALEEKKENLVLICGGKDKKLDLTPLVDKIIKTCKEVYLIGETAEILEEKLKEKNYKNVNKVKYLENAVIEIAKKIDINLKQTVLFSPAASSFDQFESFEQRGKIFKELVKRYLGD